MCYYWVRAVIEASILKLIPRFYTIQPKIGPKSLNVQRSNHLHFTLQ
jgi:hypothetical protein